MPIVITPSGEYVDDQTGMPVDPRMIQQLDPRSSARQGELMGFTDESLDPRSVVREGERMMPKEFDPMSVVREGEMARENIPANLDMGMDSEMRAEDLSDVDKVRMLIDMGLSPQEAMEAIGREKAMEVRPQEFGVPTQDPGMGALSGVPAGNQAPMPMPMPRPEDLMQRQMPMGRDRTFNPNDMLRPDNAPNT